MRELTLTRRELLIALGALGLGAAATACSGSSDRKSATPSPGSIRQLSAGASPITLASPNAKVNPGRQLFSFFLVDRQGRVIPAADPELWLAQSQDAKAIGPVSSSWFPLTGYAKTHDHSPKSPLALGVYSAQIDVATPGYWFVAASITQGSTRLVGNGVLPVTTGGIVAASGSKAISVRTPVATTSHGLKEICTRKPPDHMHSISLDAALRNGKPTVVSFATPLLCQTQFCGPTVDEQILVFEKYGPQRANFIHVEEFLPGRNLQPPQATLQNQSPAFKSWGLTTEPWVFVIDRTGIIRGRLGPGVTAAQQIEQVLQPLL